METKEICKSMREIGEAFKNFKSSQERRVGRLETMLRRPTRGAVEESPWPILLLPLIKKNHKFLSSS